MHVHSCDTLFSLNEHTHKSLDIFSTFFNSDKLNGNIANISQPCWNHLYTGHVPCATHNRPHHPVLSIIRGTIGPCERPLSVLLSSCVPANLHSFTSKSPKDPMSTRWALALVACTIYPMLHTLKQKKAPVLQKHKTSRLNRVGPTVSMLSVILPLTFILGPHRQGQIPSSDVISHLKTKKMGLRNRNTFDRS